MTEISKSQTVPEINFSDPAKMPIYALLILLGKRVLRPGGMVLTKQMLGMLDISTTDEVVEFAPGIADKSTISYNLTAVLAIGHRHPRLFNLCFLNFFGLHLQWQICP